MAKAACFTAPFSEPSADTEPATSNIDDLIILHNRFGFIICYCLFCRFFVLSLLTRNIPVTTDSPQYELHNKPDDHHWFTVEQQLTGFCFVLLYCGENTESEAAEHHQKPTKAEKKQLKFCDTAVFTSREGMTHLLMTGPHSAQCKRNVGTHLPILRWLHRNARNRYHYDACCINIAHIRASFVFTAIWSLFIFADFTVD